VDLGARRIGVAVSDTDGRVASPIEVVDRSGSHRSDHRRLVALAAEWEAEVIVVGVPFSLDGGVGPAAAAVLDEVEELRAGTALRVETIDERFTTVEAERRLRAGGVDARRGRRVVDMVAASVLLQAWLDAGGARGAST
jgi:putative Holliday junction resolvase